MYVVVSQESKVKALVSFWRNIELGGVLQGGLAVGPLLSDLLPYWTSHTVDLPVAVILGYYHLALVFRRECGNFTLAVGNDFTLTASDDFTLTASDDFTLTISDDFTLTAGGDFTLTVGGDFTLAEGDDFTLAGGIFVLTGINNIIQGNNREACRT
ncbi:hypothetical protein EJ03DRAFT_355368 [Teratosphaeria nubilosa]|uniref:Uncharacterized protein n=1 Tax=Teratosphaeria nubilosa TaxID=161662 RepID=A0A6G1KW19_9PEZI|nr:hypothetical protein EJ03DRAFT_355368 [Teratosphaeria nubilosa]